MDGTLQSTEQYISLNSDGILKRSKISFTVVPVQGMPGTTKEIGARYLIASVVVDQEPNALVDLLNLANKGEESKSNKGNVRFLHLIRRGRHR